MLRFWDSMRGLLAERSYDLYEFVPVQDNKYGYAESTIQYNPHPDLNVKENIYEPGEGPFPYAYMGGNWEPEDQETQRIYHTFGFGQLTVCLHSLSDFPLGC